MNLDRKPRLMKLWRSDFKIRFSAHAKNPKKLYISNNDIGAFTRENFSGPTHLWRSRLGIEEINIIMFFKKRSFRLESLQIIS